jgi:hypothetical protein
MNQYWTIIQSFSIGPRNKIYDAREAIRLKPNWALAHKTRRVSFQFVSSKKNNDQPILVDFEDSLPMDENFFGAYLKPDSFNITNYLNDQHTNIAKTYCNKIKPS